MDITVRHIKSFFAENSTLMMSFEEAGTNVTKLINSALQNTSFMNTWNKTMQDAVNFF